MTCFPASQLDGTDFCTEFCDAPMSLLPAENAVCVQGNAKLEYCDRTVRRIKDLEPLVTDTDLDEDVSEIGHTLEDFYADGDEDDGYHEYLPAGIDGALRAIFTGGDRAAASLSLSAEELPERGRFLRAGAVLPPKDPRRREPRICVPNCDSKGRCP
jgi:hypothetical protein